MNYLKLLTGAFLFASVSFWVQATENIVEIKGTSQLESEVLQSGKPAIIKISAPWCGACTRAKGPYESLAADPANAGVIFAAVDADASPDIVQKYSVQGLPTFIFIKDGKEVKKSSGFSDNFKKEMNAEISSLRGGQAPAAEKKTEESAEESATCAANPPDNFLERAYTAVVDFFTSIADTVKGWFR